MSGPGARDDSASDATPPGTPGVPPTEREQGRRLAVDGLLYTEFGQGRGTAGDRALARLRADAHAVVAPPAGRPAPRGATPSSSTARPGSGSATWSGSRRRAYRAPVARGRLALHVAWAAAAALALVGAVALLRPADGPREEPLRVASLRGVAGLREAGGTRMLRVGDRIDQGRTVETGALSSIRLDYADGTHIELAAGTRLAVLADDGRGGKHVRLEQGALNSQISPQPAGQPMRFTTPDAQALVLGTRLNLATDQGATRLAVTSGLVRLVRHSDQRAVEVPAGRRVVADQFGALVVQALGDPLDLEPMVASGASPVPALPAPQGAGSGLIGEYFGRIGLEDLRFTRTDPQVDFDWGLNQQPDPAMPSSWFSVRWSGHLEARYSGFHTFATRSDDGVRLYIDGELIIDNWFEHPDLVQYGSAELVAGHRHEIVLEYCAYRRFSFVQLFWMSAQQPRQIVPQSQLHPVPGVRSPTPAALRMPPPPTHAAQH